jgi:hypothetical protein
MEKSIEIFATISLTIVALSHIAQPGVWVEFFTWLRAKGYAGVFAMGLLYLNFGALIVAFHNIWEGLPMMFTIVGWGQVLKGFLYLVAPAIGMRGMQRISPERAWIFVVGGAMFLVLCAAMWYVVLTR